jgi:2-dehydropantoate 2-reductase
VHHAERVAPWPAVPVLSYVYVENGRPFAPPREHFTVPTDDFASRFAALFAGTDVTLRRESEFHTAAWRKCLHNCVSNPLTAIAGRGLEILREPHYRDWACRILSEAIPIAQADGASVDAAEPTLDILASYPPGTRTSMLQDRERGKPLEIDALNGTVVRLGRHFGIETPVNAEIVRMLATDSVPRDRQISRIDRFE